MHPPITLRSSSLPEDRCTRPVQHFNEPDRRTGRLLQWVLAAALIALSGLAMGQIWSNPITGTNPGGTNPYTAGQTVNTNITVSGIGYTGVGNTSANDRFNTSGWDVTSLTTTKYISWTLTPNTGATIDFTSLTGVWQWSATGPTNYAFRSSLDGFAGNIVTGTIRPASAAGNTSYSLDLSSTTFNAITTAITFRLYAWGASGGTGTFSINDFAFNGSVAAAPPPPSIAVNTSGFNGSFGSVAVSSSSAASSFTVSGANLTAPLMVTPPTGFEIKKNTDPSFSTSAINLGSGPTINATTIDVRFSPVTPPGPGPYSGNVACTSAGATTQNMAVNGTGVAAGVPPTELAIIAISLPNPVAGQPFSVTVQAQDGGGTARAVSAATGVSISVFTGSGTLGGTTTGTIAIDATQQTISGLTYSPAENGVKLNVARTSGDALTSGQSASFNVLAPAQYLDFTNVPASGTVNVDLGTFQVVARRPDASVATEFTGAITISVLTGPGGMSSATSLTKNAVDGIASFGDIRFNSTGNRTLKAAAAGLSDGTSTTIAIGAAPVVIYSNPITDPAPNTDNPYTNGQTFNSNISVSGIGRGAGATGTGASNRYNANSWDTGSLDATAYFTWTLTPNSGYKIDFASLTGTWQRSGTGPNKYALRSSLNSFGADIATGDITGSGDPGVPYSLDLGNVAFNEITSAIEFRLYAWGASASGGTFSINDFAFNGQVIQLPAINASVTSLPPFNTQVGTPSGPQTFTVSGVALTDLLVVTAPAGFEVREEGVGSYGSSVSFTPSGGSVSKTIEVRLSGASVGTLPPSNVVCSSTTPGAASKNVQVSGEVVPVITKIQFSATEATVAENAGSVDLTVGIVNPGGTGEPTDFQVVLVSGDPAVVGNFTTQNLFFPAGSGTPVTLPVTITDNGHWNTASTVVFGLQAISGGYEGTATAETNVTFTLVIDEYLGYSLVLNEVDYTHPGEDAEFIELKNTGTSSIDLQGFDLVLVFDDGGVAEVYDNVTLPGDVLAPGAHYVICGNAANVPHCDFVAPTAVDFIAGGLAAGIGLRDPSDNLIDAVSYEGNVPGYTEGSSAALIDPGADVSLARIPDGQDTQQNGTDFWQSCPTPGAANTAPGQACNDGDDDTVNDQYDANCVCTGSLLDCEGEPGGPALVGTPCDDGDEATGNDVYGANCVCAGEAIDCNEVAGGSALPGTACDDGNAFTENDTWTTACDCEGTLVPTPPTVVTGGSSAIGAATATASGSITSNGSSDVIAHGIEYSTVNGFGGGDGTPVFSTNLDAGSFTAVLGTLEAELTYYFRAFATNSEGTGYGDQATFTTTQLDAPIATDATNVGAISFDANWSPVDGAAGYRLDVSLLPTFGTPILATDLFFSEYAEGSSNNKFIEIFNGTGATVDLTNYKLQLYTNGSPTVSQELTLSGDLPSGSTIVVKHGSASAALYSGPAIVSSTVINFNGNDAVALFKISTSSYVDIFGRIGNDPGTAWTAAGGYSTMDKTLRRKPTVTSGITVSPTGTGAGAFTTLASEWDLFNVDVASGLGNHDGFISFIPSFIQGYNNLAVAGAPAPVLDLEEGTTYYYRVRATSPTSTSGNSNVKSATTQVTDCEGEPGGPALVGTPCNDGNACTANDVYDADCNCAGTFQDSDGDGICDANDQCPGGPEPGQPCDPGPGFENGVMIGCTCVGTPVVACTTAPDGVKLEFAKNNTVSLTWSLYKSPNELVYISTIPEVVNGGDVTTCLPDGDFYLVVESSGSGIGGGYVLSVGGQRVVDNTNNFLSGSTSQISSNLYFRIAGGQLAGNDRMITASSDRLDLRRGVNGSCIDKLTADNSPNGTSGNVYQYWFYDPNGGLSQVYPSATTATANVVNVANLGFLANNTLYNVRVRTRATTSPTVTWREWGPAVRLKIDNARGQCPLTKLQDEVGNTHRSCGVTKPVGTTQASLIYAKPKSRFIPGCGNENATKYQFRFRNEVENVLVVKDGVGVNPWTYLNMTANVVPGHTNALAACGYYQVEVRVSFDGGATWCVGGDPYTDLTPWGEVCDLYTAGCSTANGGNTNMVLNDGDIAAVEGRLLLYPNPNNGEQLYLSLDAVPKDVRTVSVELYDLFGKRVDSRTLAVNDAGFVNTVLELSRSTAGGQFAAGMYTVSITAGEKVYTERLVVQP